MTTLAITDGVFGELVEGLSEHRETAWVLVARVALDGQLLLARSLHPVPDEAYAVREPLRLQICSGGYLPAFKAAARDGSIPVFVHTHPGGPPDPSEWDNEVDEELRALAAVRVGPRGYASLVLGGTANVPRICGQVWLAGSGPVAIQRVRLAGSRCGVVLASEAPDDADVADIFDRHVRAFGPEGQRILRRLRIGVVGAGGTGSPTIEQLSRLGVGTVVAFDDDVVDRPNLTRIHQTSLSDVGDPKVAVAKAASEAHGTGCHVEALEEKITNAKAISDLASCDVVFGCTDDHAGRLVLSRLAYHYLVPVIDCGVVITSVEGQISDIVGRVTYVAPSTPCLICRKQVDVQLAGQELLDPEERRRLIDEGYAQGLDEPNPAVVAFTTAVSALAVNELLARFFGYGRDGPSQLLIRFAQRDIKHAGGRAQPGHLCDDPSQWGQGDTDPPLGITGLP